MIRKIVDYQKLDEQILSLLVAKFPEGYDDADIITFRNTKNEVFEAVEIRTDDTIFLVKIGKRLIAAMEELEKDEKQNSKMEDEEDTTNFNEALEIPDEEIE